MEFRDDKKVGGYLRHPQLAGGKKLKIVKYHTPENSEYWEDFVSTLASYKMAGETPISEFSHFTEDNHNLLNISAKNGKPTVEVVKSNGDNIYKIYHPELCNITLYPNNNGTVELYRFEIIPKGMGIGTTMLNVLNKVSVMTDIPIILETGVVGVDRYEDTKEDEEGRMKFYESNGFTKIGKKGSATLYSNKDLIDDFYKDE